MDWKTISCRTTLRFSVAVGCACIIACSLYYSLPHHVPYRYESIKGKIGHSVTTKPSLMARKSFVSGMRSRLPRCIVIGAKKTGTRALLTFLNLHPDIVTSPKEAHFFDEFFQRGLTFYRRQMPPSYGHQITIEKTARYFHIPDIPERVHRFNSSIKMLLTLRDPVERIISHYTHMSSHNSVPPSLESIILDNDGKVNVSHVYVNISSYYKHLTRWLKYFELDQIHVIDGEELVKTPFNAITSVENFLGLRNHITRDRFYFNKTKGFYCYFQSGQDQCLGNRKGRRHPAVDQSIIEQLRNYFAPMNEQLFSLINKRFDW